ncbi:tryptophan-rich antigen [Plasmodium cynomolgi strain B]|uniref:Tryptophan-rich antigen n=1 Tax=Plasmodium cynomolgi (strain B) TaxID=1120755 RepID=K6UZZ2_PLACD|nr:tryptophan-rich antigen [Plasmodium cynomolgi strain B]GAB69569.1 tryptophan-rich antigen [Plasmodium cynomolgi strain B]
MVSLRSIALFTLTSTLILSIIPPSLQNESGGVKDCPQNKLNMETAEIEKTEEWKENEWNKWKLELEDNWKQFNLSLIKEKTSGSRI